MFKKTMTFCNKGVVRADPPPPQLWSKTTFLHFFWDPSLSVSYTLVSENIMQVWVL